MDDIQKTEHYKKLNYKEILQSYIYEAESGWYIIDGIEWVFNPESSEDSNTSWRTNVRITRREWPIPSNVPEKKESDNEPSADVVEAEPKTITKAVLDKAVLDENGNPIRDKDGNVLDKDGNIILSADEYVALNEVVVTAKGPQTTELNEVVVTAKRQKNTLITDNLISANIPSAMDIKIKVADPGDGILYTDKGYEYVSNIDSYVSNNQNISADQIVKKIHKVNNSTIPLTGLKDYMQQLYRAIESASDNRVKLVSARRWAVDQDNHRYDGNAFVKRHGYYKCMNAIGEIMYFKNNNSRHLYGEAFDIINSGGLDFNDLMLKVIMVNSEILTLMYDNGVSAYIEQSKDDTGTTTKHYHIGTDTIRQREFWASVKALLGTDIIPGTYINFTNYMANNNKKAAEIIRSDVQEV